MKEHDRCNDPPLPRIVPLQRMTRAVQDLQPNTRYSLRLRTVSRFNVPSDWSEAIDFTTPETSYKPPLSRPLLYEGHTSLNVKSDSSALAKFTDGDLRAWPKENIVTEDNIHFSAPFYAPGTIRLDWEWASRSGPWPNEEPYFSAFIELRDKESLIIVDKWEIPMTVVGGITVPMHYSPDYEWRLNVNGPQGLQAPLLASFNARVRLAGVEVALWDLIFKSPAEPEDEDFECPDLSHTDWVIKKSASAFPELYVSGGGFGPNSSAPQPDQPSPTALPRGGPLSAGGGTTWLTTAHFQWGDGVLSPEYFLLDYGDGNFEWLFYVGRHPKTGGGNNHLYNHPWNTWGDDCIIRNKISINNGFSNYENPDVIAGSSPFEAVKQDYVFPGRAMLDRNNHSRDHGISTPSFITETDRPVHHGDLNTYVMTRITDEFRDVPRWRFEKTPFVPETGFGGIGVPFVSILEEIPAPYSFAQETTASCNISPGWAAYITFNRRTNRILLRAVSSDGPFPTLDSSAVLQIDVKDYNSDFNAYDTGIASIYKIKDGTIFLLLQKWTWIEDPSHPWGGYGGEILIYVQFEWNGTSWTEVGHKSTLPPEKEFSTTTLFTQNINGVLYRAFQNYSMIDGDWLATEVIVRMPQIGEGEPSYAVTGRESWGGESQRLVPVDGGLFHYVTYALADNQEVYDDTLDVLPVDLSSDGSMEVRVEDSWFIGVDEFRGWGDVQMVALPKAVIIFGATDAATDGDPINDAYTWQVVCVGSEEEESAAGEQVFARLADNQGYDYRIWTSSVYEPIISLSIVDGYLILNKLMQATSQTTAPFSDDGGPFTRMVGAYNHGPNTMTMQERGMRTAAIKLPEDFKSIL